MATVKKMVLDGEQRQSYEDLVLGIDLGTTNSAVGIYRAFDVPILHPMNNNGRHTLPSCVKWKGGSEFVVGEEAYAERYKPNVIYSVKRMMGSNDPIILSLRQDGTIPTLGDPDWNPETDLALLPEEVSAMILKELVDKVRDSYPGVYRCIITVPAYFDQKQIEATIKASKLASLECLQVLKEPTSASYIYSLLGYARDGSVLVYDLGGGTCDITHLSFIRKDAVPRPLLTSLKRQYGIDTAELFKDSADSPYYCQVLGTYGNSRLGGDDIDRHMAEICAKASGCTDLTDDEFEQLIFKCEQFKKNNYDGLETYIGGHKINMSLNHLHEAIKVVYYKTMDLMSDIGDDELNQVSTIVLVGGSTKSDYLVQLIESAFPGKEISRVLDPDATVALGASAVARDLQNGKGLMYQDVLPLPIGIVVNESTIDVCVKKNTAMPYSVTRQFSTMYDNQKAISLDVYQGISSVPSECTYLGRLRFADLPQVPAGDVKVYVSFILSAQGRLRICSKIAGTEKEEQLIVDNIFNVADAPIGETAQITSLSEFSYDEFEVGIADLLVGNEKARELILARRFALESGDASKAEELEAAVLEVL